MSSPRRSWTLAGYAASALTENGAASAITGPGAFEGWREHLTQALMDLAATVRIDSPDAFARKVEWHRRAFAARGVSEEALREALTALRDVLRERLPEDAAAAAEPHLEKALTQFDFGPPPTAPSALTPETIGGQAALRYLESVLAGDRLSAIDGVLEAIQEGLEIRDAYMEVIAPALEETGRLWHTGELTVAEEHFVTDTTRSLMAILAHEAPRATPLGKTVLAAAVQGNGHDLGVRMVANFFEMDGWRAVCLGANVPADEVAQAASYFKADVVLLSATLMSQLKVTQQTIERVRAIEPDRDVKVLVGGPAFREGGEELWRKVGADGHAATAREAPETGRSVMAL